MRRYLAAGVAALALALAAVASPVAAGPRLDSAPPAAASAAGAPVGPAAPVLPATAVAGSTAPAPLPDRVRRAVRPSLRTVGLTSSAVVLDPADGTVLYGDAPDTGRIPGSTLKLLTALAVLDSYGPDARVATRVVQGAKPGRVVLVGGGDGTLVSGDGPDFPGLRPASLADLAERTAAALSAAGTTSVRLAYDDSLFTGPTLGPGWATSYPALGIAAPITALMVDGGRVAPGSTARVSDPAAVAAARFADALRAQGVSVSAVSSGRARDDGAELARVESPTMADLVEHTLTESDNTLAEVLAHLAGAKASGTGSFESGAAATIAAMDRLGVPTAGVELYDGSGLSRDDLVTATALVQTLAKVSTASPQALWPIGTGLPVAGLTGTLADRFRGLATRAGAGVVRAKTGTLTGVTSLAGIVRDADGRVLVFAFLGDAVSSVTGAREAMDRAATKLAGCGCS